MIADNSDNNSADFPNFATLPQNQSITKLEMSQYLGKKKIHSLLQSCEQLKEKQNTHN